MSHFRITVHLHHFFVDHRSSSRLCITSKIKTVEDLQQHISKIFELNTNFYLLSNNLYLPSCEDVRVLKEDDVIIAVPCNPELSVHNSIGASKSETVLEFQKPFSTKKSKRKRNVTNETEKKFKVDSFAFPESAEYATLNNLPSPERCSTVSKKKKKNKETISDVDDLTFSSNAKEKKKEKRIKNNSFSWYKNDLAVNQINENGKQGDDLIVSSITKSHQSHTNNIDVPFNEERETSKTNLNFKSDLNSNTEELQPIINNTEYNSRPPRVKQNKIIKLMEISTIPKIVKSVHVYDSPSRVFRSNSEEHNPVTNFISSDNSINEKNAEIVQTNTVNGIIYEGGPQTHQLCQIKDPLDEGKNISANPLRQQIFENKLNGKIIVDPLKTNSFNQSNDTKRQLLRSIIAANTKKNETVNSTIIENEITTAREEENKNISNQNNYSNQQLLPSIVLANTKKSMTLENKVTTGEKKKEIVPFNVHTVNNIEKLRFSENLNPLVADKEDETVKPQEQSLCDNEIATKDNERNINFGIGPFMPQPNDDRIKIVSVKTIPVNPNNNLYNMNSSNETVRSLVENKTEELNKIHDQALSSGTENHIQNNLGTVNNDMKENFNDGCITSNETPPQTLFTTTVTEEDSTMELPCLRTKRKRKRVRKRKPKTNKPENFCGTPVNIKPSLVKPTSVTHIRFDNEDEHKSESSHNDSPEVIDINVNYEKLCKEEIIKYPLMEHLLPKQGEIISFKVWKLSESYTPEISDVIMAKVQSYCSDTKTVFTNILEGIDQCSIPEGKFALESCDNEDLTEERSFLWNELIEPRLLYP